MQNQAVAKVELEFEPGSPCRRRIQRPEINESRRFLTPKGLPTATEQAAPAVQARRTDRFPPVEGSNVQAAFVTLRQQGSPLVPALPRSLALLRSHHRHRSTG